MAGENHELKHNFAREVESRIARKFLAQSRCNYSSESKNGRANFTDENVIRPSTYLVVTKPSKTYSKVYQRKEKTKIKSTTEGGDCEAGQQEVMKMMKDENVVQKSSESTQEIISIKSEETDGENASLENWNFCSEIVPTNLIKEENLEEDVGQSSAAHQSVLSTECGKLNERDAGGQSAGSSSDDIPEIDIVKEEYPSFQNNSHEELKSVRQTVCTEEAISQAREDHTTEMASSIQVKPELDIKEAVPNDFVSPCEEKIDINTEENPSAVVSKLPKERGRFALLKVKSAEEVTCALERLRATSMFAAQNPLTYSKIQVKPKKASCSQMLPQVVVKDCQPTPQNVKAIEQSPNQPFPPELMDVKAINMSPELPSSGNPREVKTIRVNSVLPSFSNLVEVKAGTLNSKLTSPKLMEVKAIDTNPVLQSPSHLIQVDEVKENPVLPSYSNPLKSELPSSAKPIEVKTIGINPVLLSSPKLMELKTVRINTELPSASKPVYPELPSSAKPMEIKTERINPVLPSLSKLMEIKTVEMNPALPSSSKLVEVKAVMMNPKLTPSKLSEVNVVNESSVLPPSKPLNPELSSSAKPMEVKIRKNPGQQRMDPGLPSASKPMEVEVVREISELTAFSKPIEGDALGETSIQLSSFQPDREKSAPLSPSINVSSQEQNVHIGACPPYKNVNYVSGSMCRRDEPRVAAEMKKTYAGKIAHDFLEPTPYLVLKKPKITYSKFPQPVEEALDGDLLHDDETELCQQQQPFEEVALENPEPTVISKSRSRKRPRKKSDRQKKTRVKKARRDKNSRVAIEREENRGSDNLNNSFYIVLDDSEKGYTCEPISGEDFTGETVTITTENTITNDGNVSEVQEPCLPEEEDPASKLLQFREENKRLTELVAQQTQQITELIVQRNDFWRQEGDLWFRKKLKQRLLKAFGVNSFKTSRSSKK